MKKNSWKNIQQVLQIMHTEFALETQLKISS